MELQEKLKSLTKKNTAQELNVMFQSTCNVSISWWGERLVSIDGYDGAVTINELASKYLKVGLVKEDQDIPLQDRLKYEYLWGKIEQFHIESDTILNSTWIYKYLVAWIEFKPFNFGCRGDRAGLIQYCPGCSHTPQGLIRSNCHQRRDELFAFTFDEYKKLWGDPSGEVTTVSIDGSSNPTRYCATKEMIECKVSSHIKG